MAVHNDDMRFRQLASAATFALTLTWQAASGELPPTAQRCLELLDESETAGITDETVRVCAEAAKESREGLVLYGDVLLTQENAEGAIEYYSKALAGVDVMKSSDFTTLAALRRRAVEYYRQENRTLAFQDAVAYLEHEPEDEFIVFIAAYAAPSAEAGLPFIERAIALEPDDIYNYALYARLLARVGKTREALAAVDKASKIAPKDPRIFTIKGLTYGLMGEHAKAERFHAQAVRAAPTEPQPKVNRADSLIELGRYEEAIALATAALQDRANYFEALQTRATAHLAMGDGDAALADIEQAKAVRPQWNASEQRERAEKLIRIHQTLSAAGIGRIEADRKTALRGVTRHLHAQCSNFRLPPFSADMDTDQVNADLNRYRDCLKQWVTIPEIEIYDSFTPAEIAAGERLYDAKNTIMYDAQALRCSEMPKRSKCIPDAVFTKVEPLLDGVDDPIRLVRKIEVDRLNNDLAALSKAIARHNRNVEIADFLHGVAEALNE